MSTYRTGVRQYRSAMSRQKGVYVGVHKRRQAAYRNKRATQYRKNLDRLAALAVERKFFDSSISAAIPAPTDSTGGVIDPTTLLSLNCPAQGDGPSNRDGRQIVMDSISVKGTVSIGPQADQTNADIVPDVFIALVLDTQTNAAQLGSQQVFTNPSGSALLATQPYRQLDGVKRFRVLATRRVDATDFAGAIIPVNNGPDDFNSSGAVIPFSMFVDLKGMKTNFISGQTTSVIDAIADNSLHMIAFCSSNSYGPVLNYNARLRFQG